MTAQRRIISESTILESVLPQSINSYLFALTSNLYQSLGYLSNIKKNLCKACEEHAISLDIYTWMEKFSPRFYHRFDNLHKLKTPNSQFYIDHC